MAHLTRWAEDSAPSTRAAVLAQKLVQLTMPGVPDVYQGTELVTLTLVDPDNRRAVDYADRVARLGRLDRGEPPADLDDEKLLVTSRALAAAAGAPRAGSSGSTRRMPPCRPGASTPSPSPAETRPARRRSRVVTRFASRLTRSGGWGGCPARPADRPWRDALSGRDVAGPGAAADGILVSDVLGDLPVALLVRT